MREAGVCKGQFEETGLCRKQEECARASMRKLVYLRGGQQTSGGKLTRVKRLEDQRWQRRQSVRAVERIHVPSIYHTAMLRRIWTTQNYIPEDDNFHNYHYENLKFYITHFSLLYHELVTVFFKPKISEIQNILGSDLKIVVKLLALPHIQEVLGSNTRCSERRLIGH
jgi:hypothetical protein